MRNRDRLAVGAGAALAAGVLGYPWLWRQACLTWGAGAVEVCREMPGDELLPGAQLVTTRAVTVEAWPSAVWPWLAQLGPGRGEPELPLMADLKIGDRMTARPGGPVLEVAELDQERSLVLCGPGGQWIWSLGLYPRGHSTRLVSRNRVEQEGSTPRTRLTALYLGEPAGLAVERRMLLGIKRRAEALG